MVEYAGMDLKRLLRAVCGPEHYMRNAARSLGCSERFAYQVCQGVRPMPRKWPIMLQHYAELRGVLLDRELARRKAALDKRYAAQKVLVEEARRELGWVRRSQA